MRALTQQKIQKKNSHLSKYEEFARVVYLNIDSLKREHYHGSPALSAEVFLWKLPYACLCFCFSVSAS